jgi:hypothetical protein
LEELLAWGRALLLVLLLVLGRQQRVLVLLLVLGLHGPSTSSKQCQHKICQAAPPYSTN